ncbi:hypothetical protein FIV42_24730 [Persicimonas caeni]|uniref:Uncharacterized protein n=1 Tax=Persicimonas caeni TaxID=2292766 RepID=A0A4Y6PZZ2_PERCE|nr:hypothetical protein [Persicimonas caeni]QDG53833.1 hypothetical protein FIV42_24730 [Persicimonas caeni]QED35054.1 hypothetical protein FRD00_24725 [Persicimonas caeni]
MGRRIFRKSTMLLAALVLVNLWAATVSGQDEEASKKATAQQKRVALRQVENPLSKIVRIPVEAQYFFGQGPDDRFAYQVDLKGERWLVPVGFGVGRLVLEDLFPSNVRVEGYYRVERPENASPWTVRVRITVVLPRLERW